MAKKEDKIIIKANPIEGKPLITMANVIIPTNISRVEKTEILNGVKTTTTFFTTNKEVDCLVNNQIERMINYGKQY